MSQAGVRTRLLTDREDGLPSGFADVEVITGSSGLDVDHRETPFGRLVSRAHELIGEADSECDLLWLHSRGVPSPWLPPQVFAELYLNELNDEEEDDDPAQAAQILEQVTSDKTLSRMLFCDAEDDKSNEPSDAGHKLDETARQISKFVFWGYVTLIDHCLGRLLAAIDDSPHDPLLLISAAGGHSFGEREAFLPDHEAERTASELTEAMLHTPQIIRRSGESGFGRRHTGLTQPVDLAATILDAFSLAVEHSTGNSMLRSITETNSLHNTVWHFSSTGELAVREREWLYVVPDAESLRAGLDEDDEPESVGALFAKPDDLWELNNVAENEPDETRRLMRLLHEAVSRISD